MKNFDDIFSRKAKEAFENYNADHLADEGWDAYVRKHGRKRSRAIIFPLWARAATIAVLVTIGVLFTARFYSRKAGESEARLAQETRKELSGPATGKDDTSAVSLEVAAAKAEAGEVASEVAAAKPIVVEVMTELAVAKPEAAEVNSEAAVAKTADAVMIPEIADAKAGVTQADPGMASGEAVITSGKTAIPASGSDNANQKRAAELAVSAAGDPEQAGLIAGVDLAPVPAEIRLTDDADVVRLNLTPKRALSDYLVLPRERMTTTIMTGVSGMMASIGNAATAAQGVSIGFYVERQLTSRISIRPGLAMAKHSYGVEGTPERLTSGGGIAMDYAAPELNGLSGTTTSYEADIDVVSMEIPVNFLFSIRKRTRTNLFVSTGASTVFYLNQRMTGSFDNTYTKTLYDAYTGATSYESVTTTARIESEQEFLTRVDLMGLANFSAGYSFPFSKTSNLLLEPFIQLPLKDLTSLNLRIRYGGISMKLQF